MNVPDYISPFTAYRTWHWEPDGTLLSLNRARWVPNEAHVAKCNNRESHEAPDAACSCGVYAAKHWKHLINIGYAGYGIHGEVSLWGKIEECRLGYRAQYAYPKFFIIPPSMLIHPTDKDEKLNRKLTMRDTELAMEGLIAFNVDIFVQVGNANTPDTKKIPLWVKDFGYSAQGIGFIGDCVQRYYSFKDDHLDLPEIGDRLCITNVGIAVIKAVTEKEVTITLFNQSIHRIPRERVVWSRKNNRWESDTTGVSTSLSRAAARG